MGWYKEYLQDLQDIANERAANKGCGCLMLIAIVLCIGFFLKDHFLEYSEEQKTAYALGAYIADPTQEPMRRVFSAFRKQTGGEEMSKESFASGFSDGWGHDVLRYDDLERIDQAEKFYKKKKRKKNLEHNKTLSAYYGRCYGAVIESKVKENRFEFQRGAEDHFSFPTHGFGDKKYPIDSVTAILARHKEFVKKITEEALGQCKLF